MTNEEMYRSFLQDIFVRVLKCVDSNDHGEALRYVDMVRNLIVSYDTHSKLIKRVEAQLNGAEGKQS